jgi:hypothetical protein
MVVYLGGVLRRSQHAGRAGLRVMVSAGMRIKQPITPLGVYPIRIPDPRGDFGGSGCLASKGYKNVYIPLSR